MQVDMHTCLHTEANWVRLHLVHLVHLDLDAKPRGKDHLTFTVGAACAGPTGQGARAEVKPK